MESSSGNGVQARLAATERRLDQAEAARARIWERTNDTSKETAVIRAELANLAGHIEAIGNDCRTTRSWVEGQIKERDEADEEAMRLSTQQKVAVIGGGAVVIASMVSAIAALAGAGAL